MKNISIILLFISLSLPIFAQNVQWAFNVLEVSSQKTNKDFASAQLLGLPNVMPAGASNTNAWEPKLNEDESFVKVGFLNPIKMRQLIIIESFNPGFIEKITAFDSLGKGYEIANYIPKDIHASSRILQLNINPKDFNFKVFSLLLSILYCNVCFKILISDFKLSFSVFCFDSFSCVLQEMEIKRILIIIVKFFIRLSL